MNFERFFYEVIANVQRYIESRPLHLGGSSGAAGGEGGRPGGYVGYLPQTRVAYDTSELATPTTSGEPSLLDNLNHIRYRIENVETSISISGLTIEKNDVPIVSNIRTIDFRGGVVVEDGGNNSANVYITLSGFEDSVFIPSGVYNVNLSSQLNGSNTNFTLPEAIIPTSLQVFVNGLQQVPINVSANSFSLDFAPSSNDVMYVNYDKLVGIPASVSLSHSSLSNLNNDDHPQYLNYQRAVSYFYTKPEVDTLVAPITVFSGLLPTNVGDLLVGNGVGFSKFPIATSGQMILTSDLDEPLKLKWESINFLQTAKKPIRQQIIFSVASSNLGTSRVIPIRYYVHQLGENPRIEEILSYVGVAPSINNLRLRILRNGTNILVSPSYIEILVGENLKTINSGFNDTINYNDYFQLEILQGDPIASDLTVHIRFVSEV